MSVMVINFDSVVLLDELTFFAVLILVLANLFHVSESTIDGTMCWSCAMLRLNGRDGCL